MTFKYKILTIFFILLTLLILPSYTYITTTLEKIRNYQKQFVTIEYIEYIHPLITSLQMHRGLLNGYLYGHKEFKEKILKNEQTIQKEIQALRLQDQKAMGVLAQSNLFQKLQKRISQLALSRIEQNSSFYPYENFTLHTELISSLIHSLQEIVYTNGFGNNGEIVMRHLTELLSDKLLILQEKTGQLRGLAVGVLSQKNITHTEKTKLLSLYTEIKSMEHNPKNQTIIKEILYHFPKILQQRVLMRYRLNNMLSMIKSYLVYHSTSTFNTNQFFALATETIQTQSELYQNILRAYKEILQQEQKDLKNKILLTFLGFITILGSVLYLTAAFYHSVLQSIQKLKQASKRIEKGDFNISLTPTTQDEIADALLSFNQMSQALSQNISFLDSYRKAIDEASIVTKSDPTGTITYVNDNFCHISGFLRKDILGKSHTTIYHNNTTKKLFRSIWQQLKKRKVWKGIVKNRHKNGDYYIVDTTIMPIIDSHNRIIEYITISHDITELFKSKEKIKEQMQKQRIDPLTKLANRIQLLHDLHQTKKPVLLYLNIDDFANLNDFYGAKMGDKVLKFVAKLLKKSIQNSPIKLYRLYSDEFILLLSDDNSYAKEYSQLLHSLIEEIETTMAKCHPSICVSITLSGGITTYKQESDDLQNLLYYVTIARRKAQKEHKKFLYYTHEENNQQNYQNNIAWINKIKEALEEDRIVAYFQPIVDNKKESITKYESLVRLIEKDGKVISPFFFLEIAKKAKLYTQITQRVFEKSFAIFEKEPYLEFSLNISIEDIEDPQIRTFIYQKLKTFPYPQNVILEITESEKIKNYQLVNQFIKEIKSHGTKIAIDDFGTGYSNFEHIISLNADFIKIDGSLIKHITTNKQSHAITKTIITFAKNIGSKTVVEYVHNKEVYECVKSLGADYSQGYYLGEPAPSLHLQHAKEEQLAKTDA